MKPPNRRHQDAAANSAQALERSLVSQRRCATHCRWVPQRLRMTRYSETGGRKPSARQEFGTANRTQENAPAWDGRSQWPLAAQTAGMAKNKRKRNPKTVLKLPDLEQSKSAVLNSLTSRSSQRAYDHAIREFIDWYCSEPRLAFNKTVVTRYRISLEQRHYAPSTINLRLAAVRRF